MDQLLVPAIVSAIISLVVSWILGPWLAIRVESARESARRNFNAKRRVAELIQDVKIRLSKEERRRRELASGHPISKRELIGVEEVERRMWELVRAVDSPDLWQNDRKELNCWLRKLAGPWRVDYLSVYGEPPAVTTSEEFSRMARAELSAQAVRARTARVPRAHARYAHLR